VPKCLWCLVEKRLLALLLEIVAIIAVTIDGIAVQWR